MASSAYDPSDENIEPSSKTQIGPYEVVDHFQQGGQGDVYVGVHPTTKMRVAVKVLREPLSVLQQRRVEASCRASIPGIVPVIDLHLADDLNYLVMPFVEGECLNEIIDKGRKEPITRREFVELLRAFGKLCRAVNTLNRQGCQHRDIAPANIVYCPATKSMTLLDATACRLNTLADESDVRSVITGHEFYRSRQVAEGESDENADVYGLGSVLGAIVGADFEAGIGESGRPLELPNQSPFKRRFRNWRSILGVVNAARRCGPRRLESTQALASEIDEFLMHSERSGISSLQHPFVATAALVLLSGCALLAFSSQRYRGSAREARLSVTDLGVKLSASNESVAELRTANQSLEALNATHGKYSHELWHLIGDNLLELTNPEATSGKHSIDDFFMRLEERAREPIEPMDARVIANATLGEYFLNKSVTKKAQTYYRKAVIDIPQSECISNQVLLGIRQGLIETLLDGDEQDLAEAARESKRLHNELTLEFGENDSRSIDGLANWARAVARLGRHSESASMYNKVYELRLKMPEPNWQQVSWALVRLSEEQQHAGDSALAAESLAKAAGHVANLPELDAYRIGFESAALYRKIRENGSDPALEGKCKDLISRSTRAYGETHKKTMALRTYLAQVLLAYGQTEKCVVLCSSVLELIEKNPKDVPRRTELSWRSNYAHALFATDELEDALDRIDTAWVLAREFPESSVEYLSVLTHMARYRLVAYGDPPKASKLEPTLKLITAALNQASPELQSQLLLFEGWYQSILGRIEAATESAKAWRALANDNNWDAVLCRSLEAAIDLASSQSMKDSERAALGNSIDEHTNRPALMREFLKRQISDE